MPRPSLERNEVPGFMYIMDQLEIQAKKLVKEQCKNPESYVVSLKEMVELICPDYPIAPKTKAIRGLFRLRDLLINEAPNSKDFNDIHRPVYPTLDYITGFQGGYQGLKFKEVISDHEEFINEKYKERAKKIPLDTIFGAESSIEVNDAALKKEVEHTTDEDIFKAYSDEKKSASDPFHIFLELLDATFQDKENLTIENRMVGFMYRGLKAILSTEREKLDHIRDNLEPTIKYKIKGKKEVLTYMEKGKIRMKLVTKKGGVFIYYTIFGGVALLLASVEGLSDGILLDQLNLVMGDNLDASVAFDSNVGVDEKDEET